MAILRMTQKGNSVIIPSREGSDNELSLAFDGFSRLSRIVATPRLCHTGRLLHLRLQSTQLC